MDHYLKTKKRLFTGLKPSACGVVNIDDAMGKEFVTATSASILTYGIKNPADISAKNISYAINRTSYTLATPAGEIDVKVRLVGSFNVYNVLAAVGAAVSQGLDLDIIKKGIESDIRVAGRFELVDRGQGFAVVVDYAHTPDGFKNVLSLARQLKPRKLVTVFGCGGDRDKDKRPIMGKIASEYSDEVVVTADNPRNENPLDIATDILAGIKNHQPLIIPDRRDAIEDIIKKAQKGDMILILGKGHETTQILKNQTIEFNDRKVAEEILDRL